MPLAECRTAQDVINNYRAVKERVNQWKPKLPSRKIPILNLTPHKQHIPIRRPLLLDGLRMPPTIPPRLIIKASCSHLGININYLMSKRRGGKTAYARQIMFYLCKDLTTRSFPDIGRIFERDHTTVLYGVRKIQSLIDKQDQKTIDNINAIKAELGAI